MDNMEKISETPKKKVSPEFRERLLELIDDVGCRRTEFSSLVKVNKDIISRATIYGIVPSMQSLLKIADYSEVSLEYLLGLKDKNEFYRQIVAPDVLELKEEQLLVAKDYVIVVDADVWIYDLHHMEKVEVGKQGNVKKTLFLTEPNGKRHAILSTTKGDGRQEAFDQVYYRLHDRLAV